MGFWLISLSGSLIIVSYALVRHDPVLILGAKKMGQAGYERARDVFSWESIGDKTVEVYQSVLDEQKK